MVLTMYPREMRISVHPKLWTQVFIEALFIKTKYRRQSTYPSLGEPMHSIFAINLQNMPDFPDGPVVKGLPW